MTRRCYSPVTGAATISSKGSRPSGLLDAEGTFHVDVLKVMHHGSDRNATKTFFKRVTADTYVLSANGNPDNPDLATLIWIVESAKNAGSVDPHRLHKRDTGDNQAAQRISTGGVRVHRRHHGAGTTCHGATDCQLIDDHADGELAQGARPAPDQDPKSSLFMVDCGQNVGTRPLTATLTQPAPGRARPAAVM